MNLIDLSKLVPPEVVETLSYETILAALLADLQFRDPSFSALVESDPVYKILEVCAYRELLLRQRVNDAARSVMLAYAAGTDLDQLAALYGVERLITDPGDPEATPPVDPTYESDDALRRRVQLAPESITTAGSRGSYVFHALSASSLVKDVDVDSVQPGEVQVTVLSTDGDGTPAVDLLEAVATALNQDTVRPLTDQVIVQAATIIEYAVEAIIYVYSGPDPDVVLQAATDAVTTYVQDHHRMGHDITLSGLYAALHQPGVQRVELTAPAASLVVATTEAAYCTGITVTSGGVDE